MNRQNYRKSIHTLRRANGKYRAMLNRRQMKIWAHTHRAPYPGGKEAMA